MVTRREFVFGASMIPAFSPNETVRLAFMGVNSRGNDLATQFARIPGADIACICDVDSRAAARCADNVSKIQGKTPRTEGDFRKALEDPGVDALVIAAPDHWHAPATILACAAGKHVYVEKPACHNPHEGELMVAAARRHKRVVQLGTQRRSMPGVIEAIQRLKSGEIGRVIMSRGWYTNQRPTIGFGKPAAIPDWLNYELWQGPAPAKLYKDNLIHYNWHWFWHWGTGELGNNGIHALDVCRWGLGVDCPTRVTSGGGKYRYKDDQETPDTHVVTYEFDSPVPPELGARGPVAITYEGRSWHKRGFEDSTFGIAFYGEGGTITIDGSSYRILNMDGKEIAKGSGSGSDRPHLENFLNAIRGGAKLNAEIEEGVKSTRLCHLGNIAWRTGHTVNLHPHTQRTIGDRAAAALWQREYRPGWEPSIG